VLPVAYVFRSVVRRKGKPRPVHWIVEKWRQKFVL
jgi:hypothetical protein